MGLFRHGLQHIEEQIVFGVGQQIWVQRVGGAQTSRFFTLPSPVSIFLKIFSLWRSSR